MRKTRTMRKLLTAVTATVLGAAFTVSSAACAHKHTYSSEWDADETYHWHSATCEHKNAISGKAQHVYGDDDICDECGYDRSTGTVIPPDEENPENPAPENPKPTYPEAKKYTVDFENVDSSLYPQQTVTEGDTLSKPSAPEKSNYMFAGWFTNESCTTEYDFTKAVTGNLTLYAKWVALNAAIKSYKGYNESLSVEWSGDAASTTVKYKEKSETVWKTVDAPLVRSMGNGVARADILGLAEGEYNIKIEGSSTIELPAPIGVTAYDRSGYAHFNYTQGVGAYNDDGELKEGALVIYVTEANKNDVSDSVYKNTANGLVKEDISAYIKPGKPTLEGKDLGGETYASIGYILNNRGYSNNGERETYGIQKLTFTYGAVAVRIIGNVTSETNFSTGAPSLYGLTYYAKKGMANPFTGGSYGNTGVTVPNGGTVGDNGEMARITNAKNLTIEGVGEDAGLEGWGLHFVSNDNTDKFNGEAGKSFEVRNLTFKNYPEDAVGMEGTQGIKVDAATGSITQEGNATTARIISGVERCWVHNNTFLPGHCAQPAESDKAEGDGSCDFKRGQYFTCSYNYFEYCHKTNLVGSSDDSLQYNMTYHHNMWYNCGSRIPLLRNGNVHFYNNYVYGDANDSNASLSYVHSMRANSYLFSEANFYDGCKQVTRKESETGRAKGWNNILYSCYEINEMVAVASREEKVANNCKYTSQNINYSTFDTNPSQFYYNAQTKTTDCLLDDAVTARTRVLMNVGRNGFAAKNLEEKFNGTTRFNKYVPTAAVNVPDNGSTEIAIPTSKGNADVNGVLFRDFTGNGKGKGQIATFTLAAEAEITISASASTEDQSPQLVRADGTVIIPKFSGTVYEVLPAGTYFIATGMKDKEATITSLSFTSTAGAAEEKIANLVTAIDAIPETVTLAHGSLINNAEIALSVLNDTLLEQFKTQYPDKLAKLNSAVAAYSQAQVDDVIAKIDAIGTVDENSYHAIEAARSAHDALSAEQQNKITNYSTLLEAESAWANIAVTYVNHQIADLKANYSVANWTVENGKDAITDMRAKYLDVQNAYDALTAEQQAQVSEYAEVVTAGLTKLDGLLADIAKAEADAAKLADFRSALAEITDVENSTLAQLSPVVAKYEALGELKSQLTSEEAAKYKTIADKAEELTPDVITVTFNGNISSSDEENSAISDISVKAYETASVTSAINGVTYAKAAKINSDGYLNFTLSATYTVKIYLSKNAVFSIDGEVTGTPTDENGYYVYTVTLSAGAHSITRKPSGTSTQVYCIELTKPQTATTASYTLESQIDLAEVKFN